MNKINNFYNLISKYNIKIPKIQRDYAQGREENKKVKNIRDNFLTIIYDKLSNNEKLSLAFIYGTIENNNQDFIPLDGQQRLTTLFLLYLYLSKNNYKLIDKNKSKFIYETRESTKEFIEKLTFEMKNVKKENKKNSMEKDEKISKTIKDQQWYMYEWNYDPSIKGMLVMLDSIVEKFGKNEKENKEMSKNLKKNICFSFFDFGKYTLSKELYIKMNSRGKDLSSFDFFKSTLEEELIKNCNDENIKKNWYENIDTKWINLFWKYFKDDNKHIKEFLENNNLINDNKNDEYNYVRYIEFCYLNFFTGLISIYICEHKNTIKYEEKEFLYEQISKDKILDINMFKFLIEKKLFDKNFFEYIIQVFESLILNEEFGIKKLNNFYDKDFIFFDDFCNKGEQASYETKLRFFAMLKFFKYTKINDIETKQDISEEFQNYMRIIYNLTSTENTHYPDNSKEFISSITSISKLTKEIYENKKNNVLEYFSDDKNTITGFNKIQIDEEIIKAKLLKENPKIWKGIIKSAEEHPYFCGQINFLFTWAKIENTENYDPKIFEIYFSILNEYIFDKTGLKENLITDNLFRRCMLCIGNYTIKIGRYNTFINNKDKDRDFSWKNYLREQTKYSVLKELLDNYISYRKSKNISIIDFFKERINNIKNINEDDWKTYFILEPKLFEYMENDKFEIESKNGKKQIILLKKKTKNSDSTNLEEYYRSIVG